MIDAEMILPSYKKVKNHFNLLFSVLYINFGVMRTRKQFYTLSRQNRITRFLKMMSYGFIKCVTQLRLKIN